MEVNTKLQQIIKDRNINVHILARGAGVNHENLYKILSKKNKNPGVYTMKKIADYLGVMIEEII
ncbi:MAG: helix-turn-helix transcriptional regulator [Romboutsia sp.]